MAAELIAIADRIGPDGRPLYGKEDFRQALPILFVASCPPRGTVVIPEDIVELLRGSLGTHRREVTRAQLTEIVARHYQKHPPNSPFIEAVNRHIVKLCDEARRDALEATPFSELLGLTRLGTTTVADREGVFRADPLARYQMKVRAGS